MTSRKELTSWRLFDNRVWVVHHSIAVILLSVFFDDWQDHYFSEEVASIVYIYIFPPTIPFSFSPPLVKYIIPTYSIRMDTRAHR